MAFLVGRRPSGSPLCYDTNSEMWNSVRSSSSRQLKLPRCWMWEDDTFVLVSSRTFKQESYVVSFSSLKRLRWLQAGVSCLDCLKYVSFLGLAIFFPCIQVILSDRKLVACETTLGCCYTLIWQITMVRAVGGCHSNRYDFLCASPNIWSFSPSNSIS